MRKQYIFIILMLIIANNCAAQFEGNAIISKSDSLILSWSQVQPSYDGEFIVYNIYIHPLNQDSILVKTTGDTTWIVNLLSYSDGYYRFGVQSVDNAGNKSNVLWSDNIANKFGQWMILRDTTSPSVTGGVRSWFK